MNKEEREALSHLRYRERNREILRERVRKWRLKNGNKVKQYTKINYELNRDIILTKQKITRAENRCIHGNVPGSCKDCMNEEQVVKFTFQRMISTSRRSDKKYNRLDENNFIDMNFLETKLLDYPELKCFWCDKVMSFNPENRKDLITVERLDNKIGHIKSNCEFCCLSCNSKRISDKNN